MNNNNNNNINEQMDHNEIRKQKKRLANQKYRDNLSIEKKINKENVITNVEE